MKVYVILFLIWIFLYGGEQQPGIVNESKETDSFPLVYQEQTADIYIDKEAVKVVQIAGADFANDIEMITGKKPQIKFTLENPAKYIVIIGTTGRNQIINQLERDGKLDLTEIKGKWETFLQTVIRNPLPGVEMALILTGSDRRGTAYAVYDLSEKLGVSPWYWWADVTPLKKESLYIRPGKFLCGPPAVKYRGIFINDEMWGIRAWARENFAPDEGMGLGPKTYAKIFELMLRLKANYLWPAMHRNTKPFNFYPHNKCTADDYAIIMGSSHIEPMLRNNMIDAEWDSVGKGEWNYFTNRENICAYWRERIKSNGKYENIYTLGMRGKDDEAMEGGHTIEDNIRILERIFADQRKILQEEIKSDITTIPQVFVMYTEVLQYFNRGLKVPEDVILCWPDDNFGYIRQLPGQAEQQRAGGSGVYYHIQWLNGWTTAYTWLNTTPPSLIWEELSKAYQYRADKLWILNVGDIKPGELGADFFLHMAWQIPAWHQHYVHDYLVQWASRDLDARYAEQIAELMESYFQLGYTRRPEHLVQIKNKEDKSLTGSWFSHVNYGDEARQRLDSYDEISRQAEMIYKQLPDTRQDAFFQLVLYPVKCAALMNRKIIFADKCNFYAQQGRNTAVNYAVKARNAQTEIDSLTRMYNHGQILAGDKWEHFMALPGPWGAQWYQFDMPKLNYFDGSGPPARLGIALEGGGIKELADFSVYTQNKRFIDIFNRGDGTLRWQARTSDPWIVLSNTSGEFRNEKRIWVSIDWHKVPKGNSIRGTITFSTKDSVKTVNLNAFNPESPERNKINGFVESHGYICMEAEHYTRQSKRPGCEWRIIEGLGRAGNSVTIYPATSPSQTEKDDILKNSPALEYNLYLFNPDNVQLDAYCIPSFPVNANQGLRFAVSIDDENFKIISHDKSNRHVLENVMHLKTKLDFQDPGEHVLKIWMVDPGLIIDRIVLYTRPEKKSYSGPPESFRH